jgi:aminopeptidase N
LKPGPVPSVAGQQVGWFPSAGGSYVLNEPEGAHTWVPCDDHPSDKATFRFELTVPSGVTAVANGGLVEHTSTASTDTWIWEEARPMATYLIQLLTGDYAIIDGVGPNGLP